MLFHSQVFILLIYYCQLDQNDVTDIHLAIQDGDISTIEKLVSEGADLHIQSPGGHEAIKLCYNSEKLVQETDTLRKVSNTNETDTRPTRVGTTNDITEK